MPEKTDLEKVAEQDNKWNFPIHGEISNKDFVFTEINDKIAAFLSQNKLVERFFPDSCCSPFELIPIISNDKIIKSFLVKIFLQKEFAVISDDASLKYKWVKKYPLLNYSTVNSFHLQPSDVSVLTEIKSNKINKEYNYIILECIDILVFREDRNGNIAFLMLHRRDVLSKEDGWEYPKGGLAIHETIKEGAIRELLEETGVKSIGEFMYGGYLDCQTPVVIRGNKNYNMLRVHGLTYMFIGDIEHISEFIRSGKSEEHDDVKWEPYDIAKKIVWMKDEKYAEVFFDRWWSNRNKIILNINRPVSIGI